MGLSAAGRGCRIEVFTDDDGVRLVCNTTEEDSCPLNHMGELNLDCFGGPAASDSHMVVGLPAATVCKTCANAYKGSMPDDRELQECFFCRDPTYWCYSPISEPPPPDDEELPPPLEPGHHEQVLVAPLKQSKKPHIRKFGGMIKMPEKGTDESEPEISLFEEEPEKPGPPRPPKDVETIEDDGDAWFEQVIEEFDTANDYTFGLVCVKDDEGSVVATMTIDNVNIDIRLEDLIEMAKSLQVALPRLKSIYIEEQ